MWFTLKEMFSPFRTAMVLLLAASSAFGAERVTLHSGFSVDCTRRETVSPGTVRLYLRGGETPSQNYMDVPLAAIASVDEVPDPTPAAPADRPSTLSDDTLLQRFGAAHNVAVALLAAVIRAESGGNPRAASRVGARGLMQLMPATAADLGVRDSFSPEGNVNGGSIYLDRLLARYHDNLVLAVAAYNAGPAAVDRYHGVPPFRETRLYVARVVREFNRLSTQANTSTQAAAR